MGQHADSRLSQLQGGNMLRVCFFIRDLQKERMEDIAGAAAHGSRNLADLSSPNTRYFNFRTGECLK